MGERFPRGPEIFSIRKKQENQEIRQSPGKNEKNRTRKNKFFKNANLNHVRSWYKKV